MARKFKPADLEALRTKLGGRSIVLVGLMGAGKTSIGRRLATRLDMPFADADNEIEIAAGKTISEIFADHGEAYFRDGERRVIARMLQTGGQVLATGGGAFMDDETRSAILDGSLCVWLRGELPLLMKRVRKRATRPLLQTPDPEATLKALIDQRYPVYAKAHIVVESRDVPHTAMVNAVIAALIDHFTPQSEPEDK